jgi:hypothetical protein
VHMKVTWSQRTGSAETFPPLFTLVKSAGFSEITEFISTDTTCLLSATGLFRYYVTQKLTIMIDQTHVRRNFFYFSEALG